MAKRPSMTPEDHVRLYLTYLEDPDSLRDETAVAKAQAAVDRPHGKDPITRVRALTALEQAYQVDGDSYREGFVANAKAWIEETGYTVGALQSIGVPTDVLVDAGLLKSRDVRRAGTRTTPVQTRRRQPPMSLDEVLRLLPDDVDFTVADAAVAIDRLPGTAKNYVVALSEQDLLAPVGPDPQHQGKGRAPTLYRKL